MFGYHSLTVSPESEHVSLVGCPLQWLVISTSLRSLRRRRIGEDHSSVTGRVLLPKGQEATPILFVLREPERLRQAIASVKLELKHEVTDSRTCRQLKSISPTTTSGAEAHERHFEHVEEMVMNRRGDDHELPGHRSF